MGSGEIFGNHCIKLFYQNKIIFLPTYPVFFNSVTGNTPLFFFCQMYVFHSFQSLFKLALFFCLVKSCYVFIQLSIETQSSFVSLPLCHFLCVSSFVSLPLCLFLCVS